MYASIPGRELVLLLGGLFLLALVVLGGLAVVAVKLLGRREGGETAATVTGCAVAGALGCLGLFAVAALGLVALLFVAGRVADRVIDRLPEGRWRIEHHESFPDPAPWSARAELVIRVPGDDFDFEPVLAIVREVAGAALSSTAVTSTGRDGARVRELRVELATDGRDLRGVDDAIGERVRELAEREGIEIEYLGLRRDV